MLTFLILLCMAYLFGSISSAILTCKLMRLPNPRLHGSHNPGTTNVLRLGGKKAAAIVLFGDSLKGLLPVLAAKFDALPPMLVGFVALATVLGHIFPIFFQFAGGKGVATALGALTAIHGLFGLGLFCIWIIVAAIFRYSSLAALIAAIASPLLSLWLLPKGYSLPILLISILVIARHQQNISNLTAGRENKIGDHSS